MNQYEVGNSDAKWKASQVGYIMRRGTGMDPETWIVWSDIEAIREVAQCKCQAGRGS